MLAVQRALVWLKLSESDKIRDLTTPRLPLALEAVSNSKHAYNRERNERREESTNPILQPIAVGSLAFVESVKKRLGGKAAH
jgi:hypothetical protein